MSRRADQEHERARVQLLAEIDAAIAAGVPLATEQRNRIVQWSAEDVERLWSSQGVSARRGQVIARLLAQLLASSGVDDAEPGSTTMVGREEGSEFFVVSRSRGRVSIGVIPYRLVRAEMAEVLPLSRRTAAEVGTYALTNRTARRVQRTAELTAEGLTAREIGERIATEEGEPEPFPVATVRGWKRKGRPATV